MSERCWIVAEQSRRENSHYLKMKKALTLKQMIPSSMQDGGACSLEAISLKSSVALWDNWMCGRLPGEPKIRSSIFTFNDSDDSQQSLP